MMEVLPDQKAKLFYHFVWYYSVVSLSVFSGNSFNGLSMKTRTLTK